MEEAALATRAGEAERWRRGNSTKPEMVAGPVLQVLELLDAASIDVWLDGGWAVDALLGEQDVHAKRCCGY